MTLKELKNHIESLPKGTVFNYSLSHPFSWRGSYDEVAFAITEESSTREHALSQIDIAYTQEFTGYKGGEFRYKDYTEVHFEEDTSEYTGGGYTEQWIQKILGNDEVASPDVRLTKLIFKVG